jgi:hypothetical protein
VVAETPTIVAAIAAAVLPIVSSIVAGVTTFIDHVIAAVVANVVSQVTTIIAPVFPGILTIADCFSRLWVNEWSVNVHVNVSTVNINVGLRLRAAIHIDVHLAFAIDSYIHLAPGVGANQRAGGDKKVCKCFHVSLLVLNVKNTLSSSTLSR